MEEKKKVAISLYPKGHEIRLTEEQAARKLAGYTCDHCIQDYCKCRGKGFRSNLAITCKQFKIN